MSTGTTSAFRVMWNFCCVVCLRRRRQSLQASSMTISTAEPPRSIRRNLSRPAADQHASSRTSTGNSNLWLPGSAFGRVRCRRPTSRTQGAGQEAADHAEHNERARRQPWEVASVRAGLACRPACLIPADWIYEPCYEPGKKVLHRIGLADWRTMRVAGIWRTLAGGGARSIPRCP